MVPRLREVALLRSLPDFFAEMPMLILFSSAIDSLNDRKENIPQTGA